MATLARAVVSLTLLAVAAFCVFGILATYEPPGFRVLRAVYGAVGVTCLAGAAGVLVRKARAEPLSWPTDLNKNEDSGSG